MPTWGEFVHTVNFNTHKPRILELGTKRDVIEFPTTRKNQFKNYGEYVMSDYQPGVDVDEVADIHRLSKVFGEERFDVIISMSVFEHIKYPQLAAHEMMKTLSRGGILFVQTHQTFPIHGYPYDYFRFSKDGLAALFTKKMGFIVWDSWYEFKAQILSEDQNTQFNPAFLNSYLYGKKWRKTPRKYLYEL